MFGLAAENVGSITVTAESRLQGVADRKTEPLEIKVEACGIHPYDLFEQVAGKKPGAYYATLGWKAPPNKIRTENLFYALHKKGVLEKLDKIVVSKSGVTPPVSEQQAWAEKMRDSRVKAVGMYTGFCFAGDLAAMGLLSLLPGGAVGGIVSNLGMDCLVPGIIMASNEIGLSKFLGNALGDHYSALWKMIRGEYEPSVKTTENPAWPNLLETYEQQYGKDRSNWPFLDKELTKDYLMRGLTSTTLKSLALGAKAGYTTGGVVRHAWQAEGLARQTGRYLAEQTALKTFSKSAVERAGYRGVTGATAWDRLVDDLAQKYTKHIGDSFKDTLQQRPTGVIDRITKAPTLNELYDAPLKKGLTNAVDDLQRDIVELGSRNPDLLLVGKRGVAGEVVSGATDLDRAKLSFLDNFDNTVVNGAGHRMGIGRFKVDKLTGAVDASDIIKYSEGLAERTSAELKKQMGPKEFADFLAKGGFADEAAFRVQLSSIMQRHVDDAASRAVTSVTLPGTITTPSRQQYAITASLQPDDATRIALDTLDEINTRGIGPGGVKVGDEALDATINKVVKKGIREAGETGISDAGKKIPFKRIRALGRSLVTWDFWKALGKGALIGAAGQLAGTIGWRIYWEGLFKDPLQDPETGKLTINTGTTGDGVDNDGDGQVDEEMCDGFDNDGDKEIDEDCGGILDRELENGMTYRIDIIERGKNNISWDIKKVVLGGGPLSFENMNKLLKEKKAELIEGDCQGKFAQRGVQELFGPYLINEENAKFVGADRAAFYLKPENLEVILKTADKKQVELAVLLSAMFESGIHRKPDFEEQLNATAEELKDMQKRCSTHYCTLQKFQRKHDLDYDKLKNSFNAWNNLPRLSRATK
jgi:hypothetical protein